MGADLIGAGWTTNGKEVAPLEPLETMQLLFRHREEIRELRLDDEFFFDEVPDGLILKKVGEGLKMLRDGGPYRETTSYEIVGTERMFHFAGALSWGDEPFDGFSEFGAAILVCDKIPEIGDRVGVEGSGILPFGRLTS
jgi:hypothetical protein